MHGRNSAGCNNYCCKLNFLVEAQAESALDSVCPCHFSYGNQCGDLDELLPSLNDEEAEKQMKDSFELVKGQFQVRFPKKKKCPWLSNNYQMGLFRLRSLGQRLSRDSELFIKQRNKIYELVALGRAVKAFDWVDYNQTCFIPNNRTKRRFYIVFSCAARFKDASLNDKILQGPEMLITWWAF